MTIVPHIEERTALKALGQLYASHPVGGSRARLTGIDPLDDALGLGLRDGELALLAGKPGVGKTILGLQWARTIAQGGGRVIHVCYDHSSAELVGRLLQIELRERAEALGTIGDEELWELTARIRDVAGGALHVAQVVESHPLLGEAERAVAAYGERLVFLGGRGEHVDIGDLERALQQLGSSDVTIIVDYVERMPAESSGGDRTEAVVSSLKALASARGVAVVAIATVELDAFTSGTLELHHLDRARTVAYEADLVLGMIDCPDHVCVRVVKHRSDVAGRGAPLGRDFDHYRFVPGPTACG